MFRFHIKIVGITFLVIYSLVYPCLAQVFAHPADLGFNVNSPQWIDQWNYGHVDNMESAPVPREAHSLINWEDKKMLIIYGGLDFAGNVLNDVWQYDYSNEDDVNIKDLRWKNIASEISYWIQPYAGHLGVFRDVAEEMIIFGGMTCTERLDEQYTTAGSNMLWTFDLPSSTWSVNKCNGLCPFQRTEVVGGIFNDELYIYGGIDIDTLHVFSDLWKYNFLKKTWTLLDDGQNLGPNSRFSHAGCIFGASLVTFGGMKMSGKSYDMLSDVWAFDIKEKKWEQIMVDVQFGRAYHSLVPYGSNIWAFGGSSTVPTDAGSTSADVTISFAFNSLLVLEQNSSIWNQFNPSVQSQVRFNHRAIVTSEGKMYLYGGRFQNVDDVTDLVSLDLSEIRPEMLVNAVPDEFTISNRSDSAISPRHFFVAAVFALLSVCSCITFNTIRHRFRNRYAIILHSTRTNYGPGLDKSIVRNMPLVYFHAQPAPAARLRTEEDEVDICSICLLEFEEGEALRQLPCEHVFHPPCVETWLLGHPNCPLCKRQFDSSDFFLDVLSPNSTTMDENQEVEDSIYGNFQLRSTSQNYGSYT